MRFGTCELAKNSQAMKARSTPSTSTCAATCYTNTAENFFSILKRGIIGVYHHVSEAHLNRYLAEFDFRYSNRAKLGVNDGERAARAIKGAEGKRLTYRPAH